LVFEREIPAPVESVFAAFADPALRAEWGAPSDTAVLRNIFGPSAGSAAGAAAHLVHENS
jgi:uncharacterized protein YndB with AHSA1/START domain